VRPDSNPERELLHSFMALQHLAKDGKMQRRIKSRLVCYDIGVETFDKTVLVENQIDQQQQRLVLITDRYLCLPFSKESDEREEIEN